MRGIVGHLCVVALSWTIGCAYTVPVEPVEVDASGARSGYKIPGQFSASIETEDCCKKEVRSELLMCQAPTYHVNSNGAVETSLKTALPAVFDDLVIGQTDRANGLTFTVERFEVGIKFNPVGVVPTVQATADVGMMVEARRNGESVMKGHAYAQQANIGPVVMFCAEAASTIAEAVNAATREALTKLTELLANSPTIRDMAGPLPGKQAQAE